MTDVDDWWGYAEAMKDMPKKPMQGKGSLLHGEKKMTPAEMEQRMSAMAKDMADMAAMMKGHA